jgi:SAM-dependent methyltransferase
MIPGKPDYGLDAPDVVRRLCFIGGALLLAAFGMLIARQHYHFFRWIVFPLFQCGAMILMTGGVMIWGSKVGKLLLRDRLLGRLNWRGDEQVLDVGCGHGLFLLGAAKRLGTGIATGIDLWQTRDQAGNSAQATLRNAALEGVDDRVQLRDGDARAMPFENGRFDVVLSSWALHNIYDDAGRRRALGEIVRVLKPGGQLMILDIRHMEEYAGVLRSLGMADVIVNSPNFIFLIPTRCLTARKPPAP